MFNIAEENKLTISETQSTGNYLYSLMELSKIENKIITKKIKALKIDILKFKKKP